MHYKTKGLVMSHYFTNSKAMRNGYFIMQNSPGIKAVHTIMRAVVKDPYLRFLYKKVLNDKSVEYVFYSQVVLGPVRITQKQDFTSYYYIIQISDTLPVNIHSYQLAFVRADRLIIKTNQELNQKEYDKGNEQARIQKEKIMQQSKALLGMAKKVRQK